VVFRLAESERSLPDMCAFAYALQGKG
jgi:hypothetical protein